MEVLQLVVIVYQKFVVVSTITKSLKMDHLRYSNFAFVTPSILLSKTNLSRYSLTFHLRLIASRTHYFKLVNCLFKV